VAQHFEEKFGVPYIKYPMPVGTDTGDFLRAVADRLRLDRTRVEKVIKDEEDRFWNYLIKYSELYAFVLISKEFNVIGDATSAIGATKFLTNDLGLIPNTVILVDNPGEELRVGIKKDLENLADGMSPKVVFDGDTGHIWNILADNKADIVFGSSSDRVQAGKIGSKLIPYSYPLYDQFVLSRGYSGYRGAINLAEELGNRLLAG
jgi:nitrogenase molybdenum-iron protein beta chain